MAWTVVPLDLGQVELNPRRLVPNPGTVPCFVTLIIMQFINAFNCRSLEKSVFKLGVPANKWLLAAVAWELCLLMIVVYVPVLQGAFNTYSLDLKDWIVAVLCGVTFLIVVELYKLVNRRFFKQY